MRLVLATVEIPVICLERRWRTALRQCAAIALLACMSAGCSGAKDPPTGSIDHIQGYFGGLAGDEPRAVLVARDALSSGGSAADAAVAMYFALAVTMPSAAGLGGGGVCVVHGSRKKTAEAIAFLTRPPAGPVPTDRWAAAVPGAVRGMFALHARYGLLPWPGLIRPAERMARFGVPASRALAREVARGWDSLATDPLSARAFAGADGKPIGEGAVLRQLDLAWLLGRIRQRGPGDFYGGTAARKIVDGVQAAGGALTTEDMRAYRPQWITPVESRMGDHTAYFPGAPLVGGEIAAAFWRALDNGSRYVDADVADRQRVIAAAAVAAYRGRERLLAKDVGTTGFVVIDRTGGAVACTLSMNGAFGNRRMIPGTGMLGVAPSGPGHDDTAALAPVVVINKNTSDAFAAAAASADAAAPVIVLSAMLPAMLPGQPLEQALAEVRVRPADGGETVLVERDAGGDVLAALERGGYRVRTTAAIGRVNLMYCSDGMERTPESCAVRADRRYFGYAINGEF